MVVFLSTGLLEELSKRLIEGGYSKDTPAAIVYKATWKMRNLLSVRLVHWHRLQKKIRLPKRL
mgnify:CR=1 FL=1